jgi:hypothetical protein
VKTQQAGKRFRGFWGELSTVEIRGDAVACSYESCV